MTSDFSHLKCMTIFQSQLGALKYFKVLPEMSAAGQPEYLGCWVLEHLSIGLTLGAGSEEPRTWEATLEHACPGGMHAMRTYRVSTRVPVLSKFALTGNVYKETDDLRRKGIFGFLLLLP